jgi:hypothetical protein
MTASKPGNTGGARADPDLRDADGHLRDPRIGAAWRDASREEPPAALDDAILAAARREVGAGPIGANAAARAARVPEATRPERWWWPLAAAATIGAIAFGLLQLEPAVNGGPRVVTDIPAPAMGRSEAPASPAFTRSEEASPLGKQARDTTPAPAASREQAPGPAPAPALVASPPPTSIAPPVAPPAAAPMPPPAPVPALEAGGATRAVRVEARQEAAQRESSLFVAEWIAKIRHLRDDGKLDEAAKELAAFRAAYPDHERRLPPDLRDWRVPAK